MAPRTYPSIIDRLSASCVPFFCSPPTSQDGRFTRLRAGIVHSRVSSECGPRVPSSYFQIKHSPAKGNTLKSMGFLANPRLIAASPQDTSGPLGILFGFLGHPSHLFKSRVARQNLADRILVKCFHTTTYGVLSDFGRRRIGEDQLTNIGI